MKQDLEMGGMLDYFNTGEGGSWQWCAANRFLLMFTHKSYRRKKSTTKIVENENNENAVEGQAW